MHPALELKNIPDESVPFDDLKISEKWKLLADINERSVCPACGKSRKYFCYTCYVPVSEIQEHVPKVNLPLKIDIIKHAREIDGKSTAAHAAVLAPNDVTILTYPGIPNYSVNDNVVLIYPEKDAYSVADVVRFFRERCKQNFACNSEPACKRRCSETRDDNDNEDKGVSENKGSPGNFNKDISLIKKAIFIDATWNQSKGIYKDKRLKGLPRVILKSRISQFWRHQKGSPRWYLATIEALHQFLIELHESSLSYMYSQQQNNEIRSQISFNKLSNVEPDKVTTNDNTEDELPISSTNVTTDDSGINEKCNVFNTVRNYNRDYDNLLFFFRFMYNKIHTLYNHDTLLSYKRPLE